MNIHESETTADERIFAKLTESAFFRTYRDAFAAATGLNLNLQANDREASPGGNDDSDGWYQNEFCRLLNRGGSGCAQCAKTHRSICLSSNSAGSPSTEICFAGMRETRIPVRSGERVFAVLSIGGVFPGEPSRALPADLKSVLASEESSAEQRRLLEKSWRATKVMPKEQYQGIVTLLATFALQLSDLLNRILIEETNAEPEVVAKAKRYVSAHLEERISLESVARHVGVSPYYFCKVFKQSAGMTLTEFVNRRRVEWAKRRLLNPQARVTEVAFDVGFQSISQFNRSFLKYVGESPTSFRDNQKYRSRYARNSVA